MTKNSNYFLERDKKNIEKTREICSTLPYFAEDYFLSIQMRTTPLTRMNYACDIRIFFDFISERKFKKPVQDITLNDMDFITSRDLERFLDHLSYYKRGDKYYKCNEQAKERKLCSIRAFLKYLFKEDMISSNIAEKVDSVKLHEKPILYLDNNEVTDLLDATQSGYGLSGHQKSWHSKTKMRDYAIISLFLGTGIRISELVGINKSDIDFVSNAVKITRKGGNHSVVYFPEEVSLAITDYLDWISDYCEKNKDFAKKIVDKDALFISMQGTRITVRAVELLVKKYSQIISPLKKITPHKLRSTFGTGLYRDTHDIYIVADILGHKDINTTKKHYAATSDDMRREVARKFRLRKNDEKTDF